MSNIISIVTRTKNRTIFLNRLKDNLLHQSFKSFEWIIVNDGGTNNSDIDEIAYEAKTHGVNTIVRHLEVSRGRSVAANVGIDISSSKYVMLLDDDDTLQERCLELEVEFLERNLSRFAGVTCYVNKVTEQVCSERVLEVSSGDVYAAEVDSLSIGKVFSINPILTCGFLYQKRIWQQIGGYPEHIDYTEDWYFNVRFLLLANVGIIPQVLANVHSRTIDGSIYSNTTSNQEKIVEHELTSLAWKNDLIRQLASDKNPLLTVLAATSINRDIQFMRVQQINMNGEIKSALKMIKTILKYSGIFVIRSTIRKILHKFQKPNKVTHVL